MACHFFFQNCSEKVQCTSIRRFKKKKEANGIFHHRWRISFVFFFAMCRGVNNGWNYDELLLILSAWECTQFLFIYRISNTWVFNNNPAKKRRRFNGRKKKRMPKRRKKKHIKTQQRHSRWWWRRRQSRTHPKQKQPSIKSVVFLGH